MEMAFQNGRLALLRDYCGADTLLNRAISLAVLAKSEAEGRVRSLDSLARYEHAGLEEELSLCREAIDGTLANFDAERYWSIAELALKSASVLIARGEYEEAVASARKGKGALRRVMEALAETVNNEKGKIDVWRAWVQETVDASRCNGNHAVIVDKSAHTAYLVHEGKVIHTYRCELGWNSAEQKYFQGDGATPEGKYSVTAIKRGSKYYRALLLSYPNDLDKRRFADNKRKGVISRNARIGALIEIHGHGGRGEDWTEGCVALTDRDIDHLMKYTSLGMPVTIVRRSDRWP
jgi:L,D-peptidoglycan transpeptidase YkuD (ErfK/YbiS/YcfS/YnhG family)